MVAQWLQISIDNMKKTLLHLWPGIKTMASLTLISKKSGHTRFSADTPPPPLKNLLN